MEDRAENGRRSDVESVREDLELNALLRRLAGKSAKEDCCPFPCRCFRFEAALDVSEVVVVPVAMTGLRRSPTGVVGIYGRRRYVQH